jgi:hypothetical protein
VYKKCLDVLVSCDWNICQTVSTEDGNVHRYIVNRNSLMRLRTHGMTSPQDPLPKFPQSLMLSTNAATL